MNGLASQSVHLIHGPPGTGKTKTVCELIVQAVKKGQKVLACAGSNVAVDNIVERICRNKLVHPCRIGHPSRMLPTVYNHCLDNLISKTSSQKILK
jgi:superfamily I DNA and/or RNA helicase